MANRNGATGAKGGQLQTTIRAELKSEMCAAHMAAVRCVVDE